MEYLTYKQALNRDYFGAPWLLEDDYLDDWFDDPDFETSSPFGRFNPDPDDDFDFDNEED